MTKLLIFYPGTEDLQLSNSINSVLGVGANEAGARAAVIAAKPNGEFDEAKFAHWTAHEITDGTINLPKGRASLFMGRAYGLSIPYPVG